MSPAVVLAAALLLAPRGRVRISVLAIDPAGNRAVATSRAFAVN